jgi:hypothetical protein
MRSLISLAVLFAVATPALAQVVPLPEPDVIGLLSIGAVGLLFALRRKK